MAHVHIFLTFLVALAVPTYTFATRAFSVPLNKQHVPVVMNGRTVAWKTAYSGKIYAGSSKSQSFTVVFDTGSGHVFVPSVACQNSACLSHSRYDENASPSAQAVTHEGRRSKPQMQRDEVSIGYGTGSVQGPFVREHVCVGSPPADAHAAEPHCVRLRLITATSMSDEPFEHFAFDGVLGLGLKDLAIDPEYHFFHQMSKNGIAPAFGVYLSKENGVSSEITFGGHKRSQHSGKFAWAPVHQPQDGYWRVSLRGVKIGNESLEICEDGGCTAILDTGTSLLGVPSVSVEDVLVMTSREIDSNTNIDNFDCRNEPGPTITFDIGGYEVQLGASEYSRPRATELGSNADAGNEKRVVCHATLMPVNMPPLGDKVFLWGEPVLQRYYTLYDARHPRIGFSPAVHPSEVIQVPNDHFFTV